MEEDEKENTSSSEEDETCPVIDGIRWIPEWGLKNLRFALSYQAQADDLFIVTYPRSGTTWMQNIVYNLHTNGRPFDSDYEHFFLQNPHLEVDGEKGIRRMQQPGAIKTHLPMDRVPYHPLAKYICVIRNPKDVCVSYQIFYNSWGDVPKLDFEQFFQCFIEGHLPFNDYFQVLQSVWQYRNMKNVLLLSYEEMRTDLSSVIRKVAEFIGVVLTDELLERVMKYSSFDYMKEKFDSERRTFEQNMIEKIDNKAAAAHRREIFQAEAQIKVVRQGQINTWKSHLTSEQSHQIDDRFRTICKECQGLEAYWSKWKIFE